MRARSLLQCLGLVFACSLLGVVLDAGSAGATPPCPPYLSGEIDCHFEDDESRFLMVDDRGGQGVAFSAGFDADDETRFLNFCPHCSFAVFTADVGLDLDELELLGINRQNIQTTQQLVAALEGLSMVDPVQLAGELRPDLSGADLDAWIAEVQRIVGKVQQVLPKLTALGTVRNLDLDFDVTDLDALIATIGLEHDSAFRADFNNPNDPRKSSGVKVFDLMEIGQSMATAQIPEPVRMEIESALSSIPNLPGLFEMSGDDDNALAPVTYHGYKTNLTVEQRTYTVTGQDVAVLQFTVVNDTQRILPLLEVAFIADFDVPPQSYDTETAFDPATSTVMVHDYHSYGDPPTYYWFGISPALADVADPTAFKFAAFNLDKNFSLSQFSPTIEDKRIRFFLFDPDLIGDHDDATGKSEKQGAISLILPGPMMPGARATATFCYAMGADTGASAPARAAMQAKMEGCKALVTYVQPKCGNGVLQLGETCDDANTDDGDGCSAACEPEVCGDGKIQGAETCDDGNTDPDDGCSPTCQTERCGDGIQQASEACDDGNTLNSDACLDTCQLATCGDGFVRACAPGDPQCPADLCGANPWCITGTFTLDNNLEVVNGVPKTGAFDEFVGVPVQYGIGFDVDFQNTYDDPADDSQNLEVFTTPAEVRLTGSSAPVLADIATALTGSVWRLRLTNRFGTVTLTHAARPGPATTPYTLEGFATPVQITVDTNDFPIFGPFALPASGSSVILRRFDASSTMTDYASGPAPGDVRIVGGGSPGESLEICDDGNTNDFDDCTTLCAPPRCGDGFLHVDLGEACDEGTDNGIGYCTTACANSLAGQCGNGLVDAEGEACDDGNTDDLDGCSALCRVEGCGDGVVQPGEACDDGNTDPDDGCSATCVAEVCGDGVVQGAEACDEAAANADSAGCTSACQLATCGDGLVHDGVEGCDDGNLDDGDACSSTCQLVACGDGLIGADEECDDANADAGDGCGATCQLEFCGDGLPGPDEACDDANTANGDGCTRECVLEFPDACGDGLVGPGEQCDDTNTDPGDGCSPGCQLENAAACGNATVDPGEQCDDGNTVAGDGCSRGCAIERCGDRVQQSGEQCDDGDTDDGDGCSGTCQIEPATCGNATQEPGEQCDDGNTADGDDCTSSCQLTTPIDVRASCGDGVQDPGEQCDDGGHLEGDGCDELCQFEATVCGNGKLERGEGCDDGGDEPGDGCDATCVLESVCGDGVVGAGESCDDGGTASGDGCSGACKVEFCGDGVVQAGEVCDEGARNGRGGCSMACMPGEGDDVGDEGDADELEPGLRRGDGCCRVSARGGQPALPWGAGLALLALVGLVSAGRSSRWRRRRRR